VRGGVCHGFRMLPAALVGNAPADSWPTAFVHSNELTMNCAAWVT